MTLGIPRRLSVHDVDFNPALGAAIIVKVDGVEQRSVISFDMDAGLVLRYREADGRILLNEAGDDAAVDEVRGLVEVSQRSDWSLPQG